MSSWVVVLLPVLMASVDMPPHRTDFSRFDDDRVEACLRDVRRTPDVLLPYARLQRLTLRPEHRAEAIAALEKLAARPRTRFRAELALGFAWMRLGQRPLAERLLRRPPPPPRGPRDCCAPRPRACGRQEKAPERRTRAFTSNTCSAPAADTRRRESSCNGRRCWP
jgi:hypothetical protein